MASAFSPSVFAPHVFAQGAFGNGGSLAIEQYGKSNDRYGEGYLTLLRRIKEDDEEIIMFIQTLLTKGLI